jgi:hypothetical protein
MFRDLIVEYLNGFLYSVQGFLILHRLDNPPKNAAASSQPRASSAEPHARQTVLEKRRLQQKKQDKKLTTAQAAPIRIKISAIKRVLQVSIYSTFIISRLVRLLELGHYCNSTTPLHNYRMVGAG